VLLFSEHSSLCLPTTLEWIDLNHVFC